MTTHVRTISLMAGSQAPSSISTSPSSKASANYTPKPSHTGLNKHSPARSTCRDCISKSLCPASRGCQATGQAESRGMRRKERVGFEGSRVRGLERFAVFKPLLRRDKRTGGTPEPAPFLPGPPPLLLGRTWSRTLAKHLRKKPNSEAKRWKAILAPPETKAYFRTYSRPKGRTRRVLNWRPSLESVSTQTKSNLEGARVCQT